MRKSLAAAIALFFTASTLIACGGGGSSSSPPTLVTTPAPVSTAAVGAVITNPNGSLQPGPPAPSGIDLDNLAAGKPTVAYLQTLAAGLDVVTKRPTNIAVIGTVASIGSNGTLTVAQEEGRVASADSTAAPLFQNYYPWIGSAGSLVNIQTSAATIIHSAGGVAGLQPGTEVIIGGTASGATLVAAFIATITQSDVTAAVAARQSAGANPEANNTLTHPSSNSRHVLATSATQTVTFSKSLGLTGLNYQSPKWNAANIDGGHAKLTLQYQRIEGIGYRAAWPMAILGAETTPLQIGQSGTAQFTYEPQPATNPIDGTFSIGVGDATGFTITVEQENHPELDWELAGYTDGSALGDFTAAAAPIPGSKFDVPANFCSEWFVDYSDHLPLVAALMKLFFNSGWKLCPSAVLTGAPVTATATVGPGATGPGGPLSLPVPPTGPTVAVTPQTDPFTIALSGVSYAPQLAVGVKVQCVVVGVKLPICNPPPLSAPPVTLAPTPDNASPTFSLSAPCVHHTQPPCIIDPHVGLPCPPVVFPPCPTTAAASTTQVDAFLQRRT